MTAPLPPPTLATGTRLGVYEIVSLLGTGGMGIVYRARDTRPALARDVAIKVLTRIDAEADAVARFEREVRTMAALSHPNIVSVFDVGVHEGRPYLVEELLSGSSLRERMTEGPVPIKKALEWMRQVTLGLAAAHARNMVHRDIKPENIFITDGGVVKLLDFGLAKFVGGSASEAIPADAATTGHTPITDAHVVLGTVGYMSPEQVRGRALDHRSDVFSVGVVLYELLTGRRAFARDSAADTMSAVLSADVPPVSAAGLITAPSVDRLVARCLEKAPEDRFQSTRDLAFALETLLDRADSSAATTARENRSARTRWRAPLVATAGLATGALLVSLGLQYQSTPDAREPQPRWTSVLLNPADEPSGGSGIGLALSPDSTAIAFIAIHDAVQYLHLKRLTSDQPAVRIRGSEAAASPAFSPDGRWMAFATPTGIKRVSVDGGAPEIVCSASLVSPRGLHWPTDGAIVFASGSGLFETGADGEPCRLLRAPNESLKEYRFFAPHRLPNGRGILVTISDVSADVDGGQVVVIDSTGARRLVATGARRGVFLPSGYLLFGRARRLLVARFDLETLTLGEEQPAIANGIGFGLVGLPQFAVNDRGDVVYWPSEQSSASRRLVWATRDGTRTDLGAPARSYGFEPALSPDGQHVAITVGDVDHLLWIFSTSQQSLTPASLAWDSHSSAWSSDGRRVAFGSNTGPAGRISVMTIDSAAEPRVVVQGTAPGRLSPYSWTPDARSLVYVQQSQTTGEDIGLLDLETRSGRMLLATPASETKPQLSPDGRWVAYASNQSGRFEVYVTDMATASLRRKVSTDGGNDPVWSRDGRELFFLAGTTMMASAVTAGSPPTFARPVQLFDGVESGPLYTAFSVGADGRFLLTETPRPSRPENHVTLVLNGLAEITRRLTTP